jgi:hypothetical protein
VTEADFTKGYKFDPGLFAGDLRDPCSNRALQNGVDVGFVAIDETGSSTSCSDFRGYGLFGIWASGGDLNCADAIALN